MLWQTHSFRCPVKARPWSDVSQEAGHCPFASLRGAGEWKQPIHLTLFCKFIFHIWCHQSNSNKDNWWLPSLMQQIQFQFRFIQGYYKIIFCIIWHKLERLKHAKQAKLKQFSHATSPTQMKLVVLWKPFGRALARCWNKRVDYEAMPSSHHRIQPRRLHHWLVNW